MSRFLCLLNDAMQDISSNRSPLMIHFSVQSRHITTQNMTDQHFQSAKHLYIPTTITKKLKKNQVVIHKRVRVTLL